MTDTLAFLADNWPTLSAFAAWAAVSSWLGVMFYRHGIDRSRAVVSPRETKCACGAWDLRLDPHVGDRDDGTFHRRGGCFYPTPPSGPAVAEVKYDPACATVGIADFDKCKRCACEFGSIRKSDYCWTCEIHLQGVAEGQRIASCKGGLLSRLFAPRIVEVCRECRTPADKPCPDDCLWYAARKSKGEVFMQGYLAARDESRTEVQISSYQRGYEAGRREADQRSYEAGMLARHKASPANVCECGYVGTHSRHIEQPTPPTPATARCSDCDNGVPHWRDECPKPATAFKVGMWVRFVSGALGRITAISVDGECVAVDAADARPSWEVNRIEPAVPREGEAWRYVACEHGVGTIPFRWSGDHANDVQRERIAHGCLVPVNFGKGGCRACGSTEHEACA